MAAELVGAPIISVLINNLIPIASEDIYHVWGIKSEMKRLGGTLESIKAVLSDAEKQQIENDSVNLWLRRLKDVAYDAEDILDEFKYYEDLRRRQLEIQGRKRHMVKNFFSSSNTIVYRIRMGQEIQALNQRLDEVSRDKDKFQFASTSGTSSKGSSNRESHSFVDGSIIVGRGDDKSEIINLLINNSSNDQQIYRFIHIVGMGGIGKTTLAQFVFNDEAVTRHFEPKLWVCASQSFNQHQIFNQLLEVITDAKTDLSSLDVMLNNLRRHLQNKRYLIVLDDIWNDKGSKWDEMMQTLLHIGAPGSKVIVTTRSNEVASESGSSYRYSLDRLLDEQCWALFEKIVFGAGGVQKKPNLLEIGKKIAKKCGGVPLAAKILGGMMYSRKGEDEWQSIESNKIWTLPEGEDNITRILRLSYDHLEPHLKQCFMYCALFPKDHIIKRKNIIQMWMAEGFLGLFEPSAEMEMVGNDYFKRLLNNSFFKDEKKNELGEIKSCKMHDLVHDLAQTVARTECSMVNANKLPDADISKLHRVHLVFENESTPFPKGLFKIEKLRTFSSAVPEFVSNRYAKQFFSSFRYVRVMDLSRSAISELSPSIAKLKHLRYVNLSDSKLSKLPKSFTTLYNLQTLILKNCSKLNDLPRDMGNLINLRHLIISKTQADKEMPPMLKDVKKLVNLQYLPVFVVGKNSGFGLDELRDLNHLGGKLHIHNLENATSRKVAEAGGLKEKRHILRLELHWNESNYDDDSVRDDFEVLEGLQPHPNLKRLGIYNYLGSKFPTWMMSQNSLLLNLLSISLENCSKCENLPPLGLLPFLKVLRIDGLAAVKKIGSEFYGASSSRSNTSSFPSLEDLSISRMVNLIEWSSAHVSSSSSSSSLFPRLKQLKIKYCHRLEIMPTQIRSLREIEFEGCNGKPITSLVERNLASLANVKISSCDEIMLLPQGLLSEIKSLRVLECPAFEGFESNQDHEKKQSQILSNNSLCTLVLCKCPALISWPDVRRFDSLYVLVIVDCRSQNSIPCGIERLPKLEHLVIGGFSEDLDTFPFPAALSDEKQGTKKGPYFPSLRSLSMYGWPKLKCLPDQVQHIASLQFLTVYHFPSLVALPEWLGELASLWELRITDCENMKHMPSTEQMLRLTSLQEIYICDCSLLEDRCKQGGEEFTKVSHITVRNDHGPHAH